MSSQRRKSSWLIVLLLYIISKIYFPNVLSFKEYQGKYIFYGIILCYIPLQTQASTHNCPDLPGIWVTAQTSSDKLKICWELRIWATAAQPWRRRTVTWPTRASTPGPARRVSTAGAGGVSWTGRSTERSPLRRETSPWPTSCQSTLMLGSWSWPWPQYSGLTTATVST